MSPRIRAAPPTWRHPAGVVASTIDKNADWREANLGAVADEAESAAAAVAQLASELRVEIVGDPLWIGYPPPGPVFDSLESRPETHLSCYHSTGEWRTSGDADGHSRLYLPSEQTATPHTRSSADMATLAASAEAAAVAAALLSSSFRMAEEATEHATSPSTRMASGDRACGDPHGTSMGTREEQPRSAARVAEQRTMLDGEEEDEIIRNFLH